MLKGLLQGSFSLLVFGWVQILMDLQPLFAMLTGQGALHGFSHTVLGSVLIALFGAWSGCWLLKRFVLFERSRGGAVWLEYLGVQATVPVWVALSSALLGSASHVFLDSIMHADVMPWYPWSSQSSWYHLVDIDTLHRLCLYSGVMGVAVLLLVRRLVYKRPMS